MSAAEKSARPAWKEETRREIEELRGRYPHPHGMLLPVLWLAQRDFGWISPEAMELVAETCGATPAHVYSLVTFYTMFETERPIRYHIQVCQGLSCTLRGAEEIRAHIEKRLGIRAGMRTEDGRFRLSVVECLASCATAPVMQVNRTYYENLTVEKVDALLEEWMKE
ncbi:MAG: NAD(P)H-dependent oxidoreductase subunit E [Candidatus Eisenbacteria bacterium]|nr:NAD(P)H-dependent oxidoreductase subunit E [Candidatus Eisenbacteria bacterium]